MRKRERGREGMNEEERGVEQVHEREGKRESACKDEPDRVRERASSVRRAKQ